MKRYLIAFACCALLAGCASSESRSSRGVVLRIPQKFRNRIADIREGYFRQHRSFGRAAGRGDCDHLREAGIPADRHAPSERYCRNAERGSTSEHAYRQFPHQSLFVDAAFSSNHEVGAGGDFVEPHCVQQQLSPGNQLRIQVGQHPCSHASCCTGASDVGDVTAAESFRRNAEIPQSAVERFRCRGVCAFLRSIYIRGSVGPAERVLHIAGRDELDVGQSGRRSRAVGGNYLLQRLSSTWQRFSPGVEEADSERRQHSGAAVVRGASAKPDNDASASFPKRVRYHFSRAESGGQQGIPLLRAQKGQPACRSHVDYRRPSVDGYSVLRKNWPHQRVVGLAADGASSESLHQRSARAFTSVSRFETNDFAFRTHVLYALSHRRHNLRRRQRPLERIRGDDDFFHGSFRWHCFMLRLLITIMLFRTLNSNSGSNSVVYLIFVCFIPCQSLN